MVLKEKVSQPYRFFLNAKNGRNPLLVPTEGKLLYLCSVNPHTQDYT